MFKALMFKVLNNMGPQSLTDLFIKKCDIASYNLSESSSSLQLPQPRTNNLKKELQLWIW